MIDLDIDMLLFEPDVLPKTYLISIAVSNYKNFEPLPNAVKDSDSIIESLKKYKVELHDEIKNADFTEDRIQNTFKNLNDNKIKPQDALIIFYNGHGIIDSNDYFYWIPQKGEPSVHTSWYLAERILKEIEKLEVAHVALIVNCCESGRMNRNNGNNIFDKKEVIDQSRILFTSGRFDQSVDDSYKNSKNSPFIEGFVNYLKSNNDEPKCSLLGAIDFIKAVLDKNKSYQKPTLSYFEGHQGGEFYFYLKEDDKACWIKQKNKDTIDSYFEYIQQCPNGNFVSDAHKRIDILVEERAKWLELLSEFNEKLKKLKIYTDSVQGKFGNNLQLFLDNNNIEIENLNKVEIIEAAWKEVSKSMDINQFKEFDNKYADNPYKYESKRIQDNLNKNAKAKIDWEQIPNKNNLIRRRAGLITYIKDHPTNYKVRTATDMIEDIDDYLEAKEESNIQNRIYKLKKYIDKGKKSECYKEAAQLLEEIQTKNNRNFFEQKLKEIIDTENFLMLYEIKEKIEGYSKEELQSINDIYEKIEQLIQEYESKRQQIYDDAIKSSKLEYLVNFISKYKEGNLVVKARSIFQNKEQKCYDDSYALDSIESYDDYLLQFKIFEKENVIKLYFIDQVHNRLKALNKDKTLFDNAINNMDKLKEYIFQVKSKQIVGKFLQIAETQIQLIEQEQKKQNSYEKIMQETILELCIPLCEAFIIDFNNQKDERYATIEIKLKQLNIFREREKAYQVLSEEISLPNKIKLAQKFLNFYDEEADLKYIEMVKIIRDDSIAEKEDDDLFTRIQSTHEIDDKIKQLDIYLKRKKPKHIKLAKDLQNKLVLEIEADKKAFEDIKRLEFTDDKINAIEAYLKRDNPKLKQNAESLLKELKLEKQDQLLFEETKLKNDTIKGWEYYIPLTQNKKHRDFAIERRNYLKKIVQDDEDFKEAKQVNTKESYGFYLDKYKNDGRNIAEAEKRRSKIILGIDNNDLKINENENIQAIIQNVINNFQTDFFLNSNFKWIKRLFFLLVLIFILLIGLVFK